MRAFRPLPGSSTLISFARYLVLSITAPPSHNNAAWMWEDFVVNFPCLVYALVVLHCITLSSAHQLQMRAAVEEAQRRQTVAEKVAEGRDQFVRYIFHEVGGNWRSCCHPLDNRVLFHDALALTPPP